MIRRILVSSVLFLAAACGSHDSGTSATQSLHGVLGHVTSSNVGVPACWTEETPNIAQDGHFQLYISHKTMPQSRLMLVLNTLIGLQSDGLATYTFQVDPARPDDLPVEITANVASTSFTRDDLKSRVNMALADLAVRDGVQFASCRIKTPNVIHPIAGAGN